MTASASSTVLSIESLAPQLTTYLASKSAGATETLAIAPTYGVAQSRYNSTNELVGIAPGGALRFRGSTSKPVKSATISTQTLSLKANLPTATTSVISSVKRPASETLTFGFLPGYNLSGDGYSIAVGGTATAGDVLNLTIWDDRLPTGSETVSYTVQSGDTTTSVATGLRLAISNDIALGNLLTLASISGQTGATFIMTTQYQIATRPTTNPVVGLTSSSFGPGSETAAVNENLDVTISGPVTAGDIISVTIYNSSLPNGQEVVSYTAVGGDTATSIATALKNAINADTNLQALKLTAISSGAKATLLAYTNYSTTTSGGATETLTLGSQNRGTTTLTVGGTPTTGDVLTISGLNGVFSGGQHSVSYTVLATDTLATISAGIATAFNTDSIFQPLGLIVDNSATLNWSQNFVDDQLVSAGVSQVAVTAIDGSNNSNTNGYAESVNNGASSTLTYDLNGNMTSDGTNSYTWDAENRLLKITYPSPNTFSSFIYDGFGRNVTIFETVSGTLSDTRQFVWTGNTRAEVRTNTGTLSNQYFATGMIKSSVPYYLSVDHLGSIREVTDATGAVKSEYGYNSFGQAVTIVETTQSDFKYAGYYFHVPSNLNLTLTRFYNPAAARWLSRDIATGVINLYNYTGNMPLDQNDPIGLFGVADFDAHYWTGHGEPIDLADVGLGAAFRNSPDVVADVSAFNESIAANAKAEAKKRCKSNPRGNITAELTWNAQAYVNNTTTSYELFILGHSILNEQAKCRLKANCCTKKFSIKCSNHYWIKDRYVDPTSVQYFTGIVVEPGKPYDITYSFDEQFSTSGSF